MDIVTEFDRITVGRYFIEDARRVVLHRANDIEQDNANPIILGGIGGMGVEDRRLACGALELSNFHDMDLLGRMRSVSYDCYSPIGLGNSIT